MSETPYASYDRENAERRKVAEVLQREAGRVALEATAAFMSSVGGRSFDGLVASPIFGDGPGLNRQLRVLESTSGAATLVAGGFVRLSGVAALSVLVDEPGLIVDDLHWLERMMAARSVPFPAGLHKALLDCFVEACRSVLQPGEVQLLSDVVDRAVRSLDLPA